MFLAEEKFWKSSGLAKYFAGVSPSRLRKYRELGSFVRLWALTFRKKSRKASEDRWGTIHGRMPSHGSNIFPQKPALAENVGQVHFNIPSSSALGDK